MASQSESLGSQASEASQTSEASLDSSRSEDETPTTSDEEFIVSGLRNGGSRTRGIGRR